MKTIKKRYLFAIILWNISTVMVSVGINVFIFGYILGNESNLKIKFWLGISSLSLGFLILILTTWKYLVIANLYYIYISKKSKRNHARALGHWLWRFRVQEWDRELELFGFDVKTWLDYKVNSKQNLNFTFKP